MRDPRVLANSENLKSYRAWEQESYRRSGFNMFMMAIPLFAVAPTITITLFKHAMIYASRWVFLTGSLIYFVIILGLGLFAVLRMNDWRRAHAWTPQTEQAFR